MLSFNENTVLLGLLARFSNDPAVDNILQDCCKLAREKIKSLESERDLLKGWKNIAEVNGNQKRQYLQDKEALEAEVEKLTLTKLDWVACCDAAPTIEHSDVQGKVWFYDGWNVRRVPYYILKYCADYSGTQEYKYGCWMAIPRPSKPKPPIKVGEIK